MPMMERTVWVILLLSSLITLSESTKLNVPKLLLPLSVHVPVNITLTAQRGCYKWVSSKPETVRVYPLSALSPPALLPLSSCSQQCLVSALSSPQAVPIRTVVQAQDPVTGHILRCDVIIDRIERIKIITTARQLFTDDPPLQLTVQAFDSEGNTFSSLAGLKFNWWLAKESDAIQAVRFVRHHDAGYVPPPHILSLEDVGQRGESVLLYGIHSGSALVKVSFLHSEHKHVEAASVTLFVIDRLHLSPAGDTYLLQGSTIRYSLWKTEQEGETEVTFSEKEYSLVVDGFRGRMCHHDIICVEWETATVTAFKSGHATLTVAHNNMPPEIMSQLPRTSVYVVKPSYMTLSIEEEEDRWVLETGRQYYLTIRIHESKGHVVHLSQNVVIVVEETEGLVTFESLSDPSCRLMQTIMKGKTLIQASLYSTISKDGEEWPVIPPIRVRQEVEIYNPLTLQPSLVVFPWQPHNKLYQHNIQVEGGSGSVKWKVSDSGIAKVTVKGVVLAGKRRGQAEIQVSDSKNILHKVVGKVMVVRPGRLQLIPQRGDCRVGDRIDIPLALWGIQDPPNTCSETHYVFDTHSNTPRSTSINSQANFFSDTQNPQCGETLLEDGNLVAVTDCSQLSLHVHTEPSGIFTHMSGSLSPGAEFCGGVRMEALSQGHAVVTITVITEACNISETATLVAYSPLKSLVSEVLLTVGSSRVVIFEGGPQPWPPAPFRFYSDIEVHPTGSVTVEALSSTEARTPRHVYQIMCTAVGKQWLVFRCGNTPGPFNENPVVEESRVHVACGIPVSLLLSATSFPSSPSSIPLFSHHYSCAQPQYPCGLLSVSSTRDATLHLSVFDQKGVQFDNFTSCSMRWSSSDPGLLSLGPQSTIAADRPTQTGNKLHVWQVLQTHRQTGTVTVDVTLTCPEMLTAPASQCVNLRLVDDVQWARHSVTLFNHPKVTENMTLIHGSGHFHAHLQDNQLASINHMKNGNIIQVSPLRPGFSTLLAHDLCLTSDPAVASILVSDITDFQIDFINIIEVRHSAVVRVRVLDSKKQPFLHHFLLLMNLLLIPSSSIISVEEAEAVDEYSMGFHVTGLAVGVVSLHLSAVDGHGRVISSSHKNMQVYPPFSFQPRKLSLAVGSVQQVKLEGGPYPQSSVRFSVSDSSIAVVTETGLVRGMAVGVVKLRGALQTHDTEAPLTFVQDEVEVEVFNLTAVRIQAPLVTLSVGTEMPVYVMGRDSSQNPLSLGSIESGLRFHWSLAKPCVLEIKPRHAQVGVSVSPSHSFSVLVRAEAPGRTSLKVIVQLEEIHTSNALFSDHLTDEIQILVFEEMQLTTGTPGSILMSPLSQYTLQSNKDSICTVHYTLSRCVSGVGLVTVDDQGMLRTGPDTGVALLEVFAMDICGINQTLFITVKVSTVWFVRVLTVSSVNSDDERALPAFPLGWSIHTKALYYDNMGQQFHSHNMQTLVTTNRDDLVQLIVDKDNQSFLVQTVSPGLTVLRVQGDPINPFLSDYTPLFVVPAILEPPGFLRPGDIICFSSPIVDQQGRRGRWDVSSSQILQITSETGVAFAKNSGTAVVYYRLDGGQQTFREVTVESASIPVIILPADRLLTNWPEASEYTVRVDLNTSAANIAQCNLDQWEAIENKLHPEAELLCSLYFGAPYLEIRTLQDIFHATPFYNTDIAQYSCRISVQPQSDSLFRLLSTLPLSIYLSACLQTQSAPAALPLHPDSPPSFQSSIWLQYVPAFHCPVTKIKLSSQQPVAEITVFGTTDMLSALRVQSDTPDIVLSHPVRSDENPTLLLIRVYSASHFLDQVPSTANITLYTDLSPQTHVVMVTRVMDSQESGHLGTNVGLLFILIFALFAVLATTAALFIAYNTMLSFTQNVPAVLTPSTNTEENKKHFYLWITPSLPTQKVLQRKQWLWKTN